MSLYKSNIMVLLSLSPSYKKSRIYASAEIKTMEIAPTVSAVQMIMKGVPELFD
jgi:hypothetical protein